MESRVYVIVNALARRYIGVSENPFIRLEQHNAGVSRWTRGKGPWKIVWASEPMSLSEARKLENRLKKQEGGAGLFKIIDGGFPPQRCLALERNQGAGADGRMGRKPAAIR